MNQPYQQSYQLYKIGTPTTNYQIQKVPLDRLNHGDHSYRKAIASPYRIKDSKHLFVDDSYQFQITQNDSNSKGQRFGMRRIYQIYDRQFQMFSQEFMRDRTIKKQDFYPTFISQFSMIDKNYIQTRFFTKNVNARGFYQYFVMRNGQYHVQFMDDIIPVDPVTKLPPWGLSQREPWKIVLMKAWLKEKKTIQAVMSAEPYQFIDAFGFPGYRALAIQKEIGHLAVSKLNEQVKQQKEKRIPLDIPGFIVVGKTRNTGQVADLGLVPNRAGYRILKTKFENKSVLKSDIRGSHIGSNKQIDNKGQDNLYKVHSSLPSYWVGEYSVFAKSKVQDEQYNSIKKDIQNFQNQFMASYFEISRVFSKFYICPEYNSDKFKGPILEDSLSVDAGHDDTLNFFELRVKTDGFINLNIEVPVESGEYLMEEGKSAPRYPYIKYLMAKKKSEERREELSGYHYYDGEYVKGYHKSLNRFIQIDRGVYYIYFKIQRNKKLNPQSKIAININTNAHIQSFKKINHRNPNYNFQFIMKSALHSYNNRFGLRTYVGKDAKQKKSLVVTISHGFDQIGFGIVSIATKEPSTTFLAMNAFQSVLVENRMTLCKDVHHLEDEDEAVLNMVAKTNEAQVVIMERSIRSRKIDQKFPPEGSIDFYCII